MTEGNYLGDEIIKWYILGCHIIEHPKIDQFNKEKFISFLKTLSQMAEEDHD